MKKYSRIIIPVLFFIAIAGFIVFSSDFFNGANYSRGLEYDDYNKEYATVHGIGDCKDTKIIIPEKDPQGREVISLYSFGLDTDCSHVTKIILPETLRWFSFNYGDMIQKMPNLKFNEYKNAKYLGSKDNPYFALIKSEDIYSTEAVIHPDTKIIAAWAFTKMIKLQTVNIPDGVNYIGYAFNGCEILSISLFRQALSLCTMGLLGIVRLLKA